jgi:hypothetical protein
MGCDYTAVSGVVRLRDANNFSALNRNGFSEQRW